MQSPPLNLKMEWEFTLSSQCLYNVTNTSGNGALSKCNNSSSVHGNSQVNSKNKRVSFKGKQEDKDSGRKKRKRKRKEDNLKPSEPLSLLKALPVSRYLGERREQSYPTGIDGGSYPLPDHTWCFSGKSRCCSGYCQ